MEWLFKLTWEHIVYIALLLVIISVFLAFLLKILCSFVNSLRFNKLNIGNTSIEKKSDDIKSPKDNVKLPPLENEISKIKYSNHFGHQYFQDLKRVENVGPIINCESIIKAQFIKAFVVKYSESLYIVVSAWLEKITKDPNHDLSICLDGKIVEEIKERYQNLVENEIIDIKYKGESYPHKGIPSILSDKFSHEYQYIVDDLLTQVSRVINDDNYHADWNQKVVGILDILDASYRRDFCSFNSMIQSLNGDLDYYFENEFLKKLK